MYAPNCESGTKPSPTSPRPFGLIRKMPTHTTGAARPITRRGEGQGRRGLRPGQEARVQGEVDIRCCREGVLLFRQTDWRRAFNEEPAMNKRSCSPDTPTWLIRFPMDICYG